MAITKIKNLISDLHQIFAIESDGPSVQQQQLLAQMKAYTHNLDEAEPTPPQFSDTAELLLEEIQEGHPKSAEIIKEVINILSNMGI